MLSAIVAGLQNRYWSNQFRVDGGLRNAGSHTFGGCRYPTSVIWWQQNVRAPNEIAVKSTDAAANFEERSMATPGTIKVLCADDHPLMRDGISFALHAQSDMELIAEASTGREAIAAYKEHRPDVTLMDLRMPDMNGIDATAAILQEFPNARVVILTTYPGDVSAARALKSGAKGYLLKGTIRNELVNAVRRIHAGYRHISPEVADEIAAHISSDDLSARELEVLRIVSAGNSNKAVGDRLDISEDTVKGHVRNILAKLQANDRTHAVMIAMDRGYFD
jgi:DNA-binding NarL/FixJ family response regulator